MALIRAALIRGVALFAPLLALGLLLYDAWAPFDDPGFAPDIDVYVVVGLLGCVALAVWAVIDGYRIGNRAMVIWAGVAAFLSLAWAIVSGVENGFSWDLWVPVVILGCVLVSLALVAASIGWIARTFRNQRRVAQAA